MALGLDPVTLALSVGLVVGFMGGLWVPAKFGMERLEGFGRWAALKIPYEPPPGKSEEEAMEEAHDGGGD